MSCPMLVVYGAYDERHSCCSDAFDDLEMYDDLKVLREGIHPNCPIKGQSITYVIDDTTKNIE